MAMALAHLIKNLRHGLNWVSFIQVPSFPPGEWEVALQFETGTNVLINHTIRTMTKIHHGHPFKSSTRAKVHG